MTIAITILLATLTFIMSLIAMNQARIALEMAEITERTLWREINHRQAGAVGGGFTPTTQTCQHDWMADFGADPVCWKCGERRTTPNHP